MKNIENIENSLKDLDAKIVDSEAIIDKLENIQNKFERYTNMEKQLVDQESLINNLVIKVNAMEANLMDKNNIINDLAEKLKVGQENEIHAFEKKDEEAHAEKFDKMEKRIYMLEKRRLGSDFCDFCDMEFKAGCAKDRKEKETHIRDEHTFQCNVCELRNKNKEELNIHLLTCEIYVCSLCSYKHKRLSELKSHIKTKHTQNAIIKHMKMDRENFTKLSCKNYFSEEI